MDYKRWSEVGNYMPRHVTPVPCRFHESCFAVSDLYPQASSLHCSCSCSVPGKVMFRLSCKPTPCSRPLCVGREDLSVQVSSASLHRIGPDPRPMWRSEPASVWCAGWSRVCPKKLQNSREVLHLPITGPRRLAVDPICRMVGQINAGSWDGLR